MKKKTGSAVKLSTGILLISEPFNPEPSFKRSVVVLSQHNDSGSIGFVVNKPTELTVQEALDDFPDFDAVVYWGGPVKLDSIYYLHSMKDLEGSKKIAKDLYWGGDYEELKLRISEGKIQPEEIKFIAGFSAWRPDQLSEEIKNESWWVTEGDKYSILIEEPTVVWGNVLQRMGHVYGIMNDFPVDPEMN